MLLLIFPTCIEQRQKRRQGQAQAQAAQCGLGDCAETVTAQAHHGLHCTERKLRYGAEFVGFAGFVGFVSSTKLFCYEHAARALRPSTNGVKYALYHVVQ